MKDSLKPGLRATLTMRIAPDMLAPGPAHFFPNSGDMPEVLATMAMVGFVESACLKCVSGHLDPGEHSLGVAVDVSHVAPTPAGMEIRAEVELVAVAGRRLSFAVKVFDQGGLIGEGPAPARRDRRRALPRARSGESEQRRGPRDCVSASDADALGERVVACGGNRRRQSAGGGQRQGRSGYLCKTTTWAPTGTRL